jgi:hypothetical protein
VVSYTTISAATMSATSPLYHRRTTSKHSEVNLGEPRRDEEDSVYEIFFARESRVRKDKGKPRADQTNFVHEPTSIAKLDSSQSHAAIPHQKGPEIRASVTGIRSAAASSMVPKEEDTGPVLPPAAITMPPAVNGDDLPRRSERGKNVGRGRSVWAHMESGTDWVWVADLGGGIFVSDIPYL